MGVARDLYQLQEFDLALEANQREQARIRAQQCESPEVVKSRANLLAQKKRVEELAKEQKSAEWEIDDLSTRITNIDRKLYSGKITNPKELSGFQAESEGFKKTRSSIEDKALMLMDEADAARRELASLEEKLARLEVQWQAQQQQLAAELEQLKTDRASLVKRRADHAATVQNAAMGLYDDLRKRKGTAVALVEQGACRGCRIALPNSDLQGAKGGGLVKCSSCGRILHMP